MKLHFKGHSDDFVVFAENEDIVHKFRKDKSIPLVEVVEVFKIFVSTGRHGSQGTFDEASNATLQNNFGSEDRDEIIKKIVQEGEIKSTFGDVVKTREPGNVRGNNPL